MQNPWGGLSLLSSTAPGVLTTLQEKRRCGDESETKWPFMEVKGKILLSVRSTSLPDSILPGMQHVRAPQDSASCTQPSSLIAGDSRTMLYFIQFGSSLVPFILRFVHLTQCDPARGEILIDNA